MMSQQKPTTTPMVHDLRNIMMCPLVKSLRWSLPCIIHARPGVELWLSSNKLFSCREKWILWILMMAKSSWSVETSDICRKIDLELWDVPVFMQHTRYIGHHACKSMEIRECRHDQNMSLRRHFSTSSDVQGGQGQEFPDSTFTLWPLHAAGGTETMKSSRNFSLTQKGQITHLGCQG